jgi:hypothetical protein
MGMGGRSRSARTFSLQPQCAGIILPQVNAPLCFRAIP